ncbi:MAG: histidine kinase, partial [Chitinophagales bacterium]
DGFLWIGTNSGLSRFDGSYFKNYYVDPNDSTTLQDDQIFELYQDASGIIWIYGRENVSQLNPVTGSFRKLLPITYDLADTKGLPKNGITKFFEYNGELWIVGGGTLAKYNRSTNTFIYFPVKDHDGNSGNYISNNVATDVFVNSSGFWIPTNHGLLNFDPVRSTYESFLSERNNPQNYQGENLFTSIWSNNDSILWLGTWSSGLRKFNTISKTWETFLMHPIPILIGSENIITAIVDGGDNNLWLASPDKGIIKFNLESKKFQFINSYLKERNPFNNGAWNLFIEKNNRLWAGTEYGLIKIDPAENQFEFITIQPDELIEDVRSIRFFKDSISNRVFFTGVGSDDHSYYFDKEALRAKEILNPGRAKNYFTVYRYFHLDGHLWCSGSFGFARWSENDQEFIIDKNFFSGDEYLTDIYFAGKDKSGKMIAASSKGFISIDLNNKKYSLLNIHFADSTSDLSDSYISGIVEGDHLWLSAIKDLACYDIKTKQFLKVKQDKKYARMQSEIFNLLQYKEFVWVALRTRGLVKIHADGDQIMIDTLIPYPNGTVFQDMCLDNNGLIWIKSERDLLRFDPTVYNFKQITVTARIEDFPTGDIYCSYDNELFITSNNGYYSFYPDSITENNSIPRPYLTSLKLFGELYSISEEEKAEGIYYTYDKNQLQFDFGAIDFTLPEKITFAYMLENADNDWINAGNERSANYSGLSPGNYIFRVKAYNSDGFESTTIYEQKIVIKPPFWQTWWFRILISLILIGIVVLLTRLRIRYIRKQEQIKLQVAESKIMASENEMKALRSQMNPHFIFNSMNSINHYILNNDAEQASEYLSDFAKLMRIILENSREQFIPLDREIEMLHLYLQAEQMRFKNSFEYAINIADEIETTEVMIPSMILQPFIENSILHGINHKNEKGHINIEIMKSDHILLCTITDDGVGRKRSMELNGGRKRMHQSYGLKITGERLNVIFQKNLTEEPVKIIDLYNAANHSCGTKVEIRLPLIENEI